MAHKRLKRNSALKAFAMALVGAVLVMNPPANAVESDIVVLANGDRLTGEVKELGRGRLRFKTDALNTVLIEWGDIVEVESADIFEVELDSGLKYSGSLGIGDAGSRQLILANEGDETPLALAAIVRITPIEDGLWKRLDGSLSLGFSLAKARNSTQFNLGLESSYRSPKWLRSLNLSSNITSQAAEEAESTSGNQEPGVTVDEESSRSSVSFHMIRFLPERRLVLAFGQLQENEELALDVRVLAGLAYGRYLKHTTRTEVAVFGGLAVNREDFGDPEGPEGEVEALGVLQLSVFTFDTPETQLDLGFFVYPSLTQSGRYRAELDLTLRKEIVEDFFWTLSLYDSFDSQPPIEGLERNDWWLVTGLGWSW